MPCLVDYRAPGSKKFESALRIKFLPEPSVKGIKGKYLEPVALDLGVELHLYSGSVLLIAVRLLSTPSEFQM